MKESKILTKEDHSIIEESICEEGGEREGYDFDFDLIAEDYRNVASNRVKISGGDSDYFAEYKILEVKNRIDFVPDTILDVGCGIGLSEIYFSQHYRNSRVHGIDVSSESIKTAKNSGIPNTDFQTYNGSDFPFESNCFSLVFCAGVMHHITQSSIRKKIISEMYRVLKPNGCMFIFEHNPLNLGTRIIANNPEDKAGRLLFAKEAMSLAKSEPFSEINIFYTLFFPRFKLFAKVFLLEKYLYKIPFGAQYYIFAKK